MFRLVRPKVIFFALVILILLTAMAAFAATNSVPLSRAYLNSSSIAISNLVPSECSAQGITIIYSVYGTREDGDNGLYLGDGNANTYKGGKGTDCLVGGGGDDELDGGNREDILLGGAGNDTLKGGAHSDYCDGGPGSDDCDCETEINCE